MTSGRVHIPDDTPASRDEEFSVRNTGPNWGEVWLHLSVMRWALVPLDGKGRNHLDR